MFIKYLIFSNDDTTEGIYRNAYGKTEEKKEKDEQKIFKIAEKMIEAIEKIDPKKYFLTLLSCLAKKNDLDEALRRILAFKSIF